ncbi:hypothetical protein N665_0055s0021 [Sinapis alba]|nr:hypothetical protein N665_0055s0021 [Sinapis alba]
MADRINISVRTGIFHVLMGPVRTVHGSDGSHPLEFMNSVRRTPSLLYLEDRKSFRQQYGRPGNMCWFLAHYFDLIGIMCGQFEKPFWEHFLATLIGKAIIKTHIQTVFIICICNNQLLTGGSEEGSFKTNKSLQGSPGPAHSKNISLGGLASSVTTTDFKKYFAQFGTIIDLVMMYDHKTQRQRGFGFVTYDEEAVDKVLQRTFHELDGNMVKFKVVVPKEKPPNPNKNISSLNNFGSSRMSMFLKNYTHVFNMSPTSSHGAKPDVRYSPSISYHGIFSSFGYEFESELNFYEGTHNQSCITTFNRVFGRLFSPRYNVSVSRYGG